MTIIHQIQIELKTEYQVNSERPFDLKIIYTNNEQFIDYVFRLQPEEIKKLQSDTNILIENYELIPGKNKQIKTNKINAKHIILFFTFSNNTTQIVKTEFKNNIVCQISNNKDNTIKIDIY